MQFINNNSSYCSLYNLNSLFLLRPFFDSGCAIYSNKKSTSTGFEKWQTINNKYYDTNKGMVWSYFESENQREGITVINLDFYDNNNDLDDIKHLQQIVELKNTLQNRFANNLINVMLN